MGNAKTKARHWYICSAVSGATCIIGEEEEKGYFLHPLLDAINTVIITIQKTVQNTKCYLLFTKAFFDNIYLKYLYQAFYYSTAG